MPNSPITSPVPRRVPTEPLPALPRPSGPLQSQPPSLPGRPAAIRAARFRPAAGSALALSVAVAVALCLGFVGELAAAGTAQGTATTPAPGSLPRAKPESARVASADLLHWIDGLDAIDGLHSVMLLRHGQVIAEGWWTPYSADGRHELYSLSKSFTSAAVGFAVAEGRLSIDDEVTRFFPGEAPTNAPGNLKAMRVRDLLTMSAGHQDETATAADRMTTQAFLAHPVPHKPGTHFKYNTPATFMLSAIVQRQTGQTVLDYLQPRLFQPLGISEPTWATNVQGMSLGGYGLSVRTEDIARFGQLHLQRGQWQGRQLLPAAWVDLATSRQVSNGSNPASDWDQGYGFQFWRCRNDAYRGDGAFGQYCIVLPRHNAVVAITGGVTDMQAVLNVIWTRLLPAFQAKRVRTDRAAQQALAARLAGLKVRPATGVARPDPGPGARAMAEGRTFTFAPNDRGLTSLQLSAPTPNDPPGTMGVITLTGRDQAQRIPCGHQDWIAGRASLEGSAVQPIAATLAWASPGGATVKICATETPYHLTLQLGFTDEEVTLDTAWNVRFGPAKLPRLTGRLPR